MTFESYLHRLSTENKLRILRLHPDLAGKLLDVQQLTEESSYEQSSVGLDKLSPEDKRQITALNEEYGPCCEVDRELLTSLFLSLSSQVQGKVRISVCGLCARSVQVRGHPTGHHRAGQQPTRTGTGDGH